MLTVLVVSAAVASGNGEAANGESPPVTSRDFDPPLWSEQQEKDFRKHRLNFSRALKADRLSEQDRQNITRGVQRYMYRMTMPELFRDLPKDVLREIISDLRSPVTGKAARDFVMQEVVRIAPELYNQPQPPRFNLAILLSNLDADHKAEPQVPYIPAADRLLEMLQQPNQFFSVKIWCAKGLGRICRDADPSIRLRDRIAGALLQGLAEAPDHVEPEVREWYQRLFIEALGDTGLVYNINRQPTIIDTLMQLLSDPQQSWDIRTAALHAVSRLQFEPSTNVDLILYEAGKLAHEMGRAYNANRAAPHWQANFVKLYHSMIPRFPKEAHQRNLGLVNQIQNRSGLGQYRAKAESLLEAMAPVYNPVTESGGQNPIPASGIQNLQQWLQANAPENRRPTPESQPLPQS
ncbi:hypothetical protein Mal4_06840 [Maioricimonas rarisocia]|uniref:Uncharacterized protein n=1 Tax=Maioricimonas rarisocia TaxID=2528026 RepID=A0A517Z1P9_9PLAN|nr:HEAT repeat domain-containing protein [Maioricimonas rarisocia]QDU36398.1 hypothetical protein Mal4_06840 [Maioricimonas rarisocia]